MSEQIQALRDWWDALSERERRLLGAMLAVAAVLLAGTLMLMTNGALADVKDDRDALRKILMDIEREGPALDQARLEKQAMLARYKNPVPPLGSYLEEKAQAEGVELRQVVDQPEKKIGRYMRRHVRVRFNGVGLRPLMHVISSIYAGNVPVAIERLQIEHYRPGDKYNVQLGVYAFELAKSSASDEDDGEEDGDGEN
jgi:hypothetical protein